MTNITHFINGNTTEGTATRTQPIFDPATGDSSKAVILATVADVDHAVSVAKAAWPAWRKMPALRRARILDRFKNFLWERMDELAAAITAEHGKTFDDAKGEVTRGLEVVEFAIGAPTHMKGEFSENVGTGVDSYMIRQPLGVVAGITPFNFPTMVPMWMFPVALATGNLSIAEQ